MRLLNIKVLARWFTINQYFILTHQIDKNRGSNDCMSATTSSGLVYSHDQLTLLFHESHVWHVHGKFVVYSCVKEYAWRICEICYRFLYHWLCLFALFKLKQKWSIDMVTILMPRVHLGTCLNFAVIVHPLLTMVIHSLYLHRVPNLHTSGALRNMFSTRWWYLL